jgi:hypothetical protein
MMMGKIPESWMKGRAGRAGRATSMEMGINWCPTFCFFI